MCITFGEYEFTSQLEGYEQVRAYCQNCHNWNAHCVTRWPFFTVCFLPLIPLSTHKYKEVTCPICRFSQDMSIRPDITPETRPPPPNQWAGPPGPGPQAPPQAHGGIQKMPEQERMTYQ